MIQAFSDLVNIISPSTGGVYESARLNDNLDGTGGITLSWNSAENNTIPVGTSVEYNGTKYMVLEPYAPQKASAIPHYRYEVTFKHPLARLARVPFYIRSIGSDNNPIDLHTSTFTGYVQTIAQKLADFFAEYGDEDIDREFGETFGPWTVDFAQTPTNVLNQMITVDFDGCSIRSAATRIADAIGCNVFFDWSEKKIRFISGTTIDGEYYNCFRVLGGTTNMAKMTVSGKYAAVTQRLTLDNTWPGSMMYRGQGNNGEEPAVRLTRDLIFDDIFPKMELRITSARPRYCYLTDEDGNKIVDHYEKNGSTVGSDEEGATPIYKLYCKWYVKLGYLDGTEYIHDTGIQIADKPLCLLFQPDYSSQSVSSPLAGREFEVVYFADFINEWEEDDVKSESSPFQVYQHEFRIIFGAEGETILPGLALEGTVDELNYHLTNGENPTYPYLKGDGLIPLVGNKVTLTNVAVEAATDQNGRNYKAVAQEQLKYAALEVLALMDNDNGQYQYQSVTEIPAIGTKKAVIDHTDVDGHEGVVTNVSADLDTGVADITIGSWSRKTLTEGIRDKIDSVTATGSGETENDRVMSKGSFNTLMRTVKKTNVSQEAINTLGAEIERIAAQADAQFNVIFGIGDPTAVQHPPQEEWTADEKEMHLQDIYYDMNREPASTGGRAWRWVVNNGVYSWAEITDMDTLLSLEKIRDVASDGILSGGAEKTRIFIEWKSAADEYIKLYNEAGNYNLTTERTALETVYNDLWRMLNGGVAMGSGDTYMTVPQFLTNLNTSTALADYTKTGVTGGAAMDADWYRQKWNNFYSALSSLTQAVTGQTRTLVASKISYYASYNIPTPPYTAGAMWFKLASQYSGERNGVLYQCINSRPSGEGQMSDWKKVSNFGVSIGSLLATLYSHWEEKIKQIHDFSTYDEYDSIPVYIQNTEPTRVYPMVWFNPITSIVLVVYDAWESENITASGNNSSDSTLISLFNEIYNTLGEFSFKIWNYLSDGATLYDIFGKRSTFKDSFTKQDIEGQLSVWMKGENAWTQVLDNTEGILQNYGDHIVAAIYGVSAETAQSMATQLTLAKNFAQLMAQASQEVDEQTGECAMKDVAGIRIIADEHEDPNDDTSPITKGHVEIVGDLVSADGTVKIGNTSWAGGGNAGQRYGLEIGDERNTDILIKSDWEYNSRIPSWAYNPSIVLTSKSSTPGHLASSRALMKADYIAAPIFKVINVVSTVSQESQGFDYQEISGVGDTDTPMAFIAKDSNGNDVTVTVIGGIITGIASAS